MSIFKIGDIVQRKAGCGTHGSHKEGSICEVLAYKNGCDFAAKGDSYDWGYSEKNYTLLERLEDKGHKTKTALTVCGKAPLVYLEIGCKKIELKDIKKKALRFKTALKLNSLIPDSVKYEGERVTAEDIDNLLKWLKMEGYVK